MLFKEKKDKKISKIPFQPIFIEQNKIKFNVGYVINERLVEPKTNNHSLIGEDSNFKDILFNSGSYFVSAENEKEEFTIKDGDKFFLILDLDKYNFVKRFIIKKVSEDSLNEFYEEEAVFFEENNQIPFLLCEVEESSSGDLTLNQKIKENIFWQNERFIFKPFTIIRLEEKKYRIFGGSIDISSVAISDIDNVRTSLFKQGENGSFSANALGRIYIQDQDVFANPGDYIYLKLYLNFSTDKASLGLYSDVLVGLIPNTDPEEEEPPPPLDSSINVGLFSSLDSASVSLEIGKKNESKQAFALNSGEGGDGEHVIYLGFVDENGNIKPTEQSIEINNDISVGLVLYRNRNELTDFDQVAASEQWFGGSYPDDSRIKEVFNTAINERKGDWSTERVSINITQTPSRTNHY